jgi:hypothetical protein
MQVFTQKNILKPEEQAELKSLMIKEIEEALDTSVTPYQSMGPQEKKHPDCMPLQKLCKKIEKVASDLMSKPMVIINSWFVICREDSNFKFHHHHDESMSVVYYLENCNNNGTIFETFFTKLQVLAEDNSAIFFESREMHCTPHWNGKDRYSIAFDLEFKDKTL